MAKQSTIYFFNTEKWEKDYLTTHYDMRGCVFVKAKLSASNAKKYSTAEVVSIFVHSKLDEGILSAMPKLKLITTRSTGYDHIDLVACKKAGVKVANVPTYGENTVAEHTFGLILALTRKIFLAYEKTRKLNFDVHDLMGIDLAGKTIGIVGGGHIGQHVARIARGFKMKVLVSDPTPDRGLAKNIGFSYARSLDDLLKKSDIVTLHAPYNDNTHHMINRKNIQQMKKGAFLINTARGGLVDTDALIWALDKKILTGAGLDVLEEEGVVKEECELLSTSLPTDCDIQTLLENHILIARDDVIVTPHNAFNSQEAIERILDTTAKNILSFKKGKVINRVKS